MAIVVQGSPSWLTDKEIANAKAFYGEGVVNSPSFTLNISHDALLKPDSGGNFRTSVTAEEASKNPTYWRDYIETGGEFSSLVSIDEENVDVPPVGDGLPILNFQGKPVTSSTPKPKFQSITVPAATKSFILPLALVVLIAGFLIFKNR